MWLATYPEPCGHLVDVQRQQRTQKGLVNYLLTQINSVVVVVEASLVTIWKPPTLSEHQTFHSAASVNGGDAMRPAVLFARETFNRFQRLRGGLGPVAAAHDWSTIGAERIRQCRYTPRGKVPVCLTHMEREVLKGRFFW